MHNQKTWSDKLTWAFFLLIWKNYYWPGEIHRKISRSPNDLRHFLSIWRAGYANVSRMKKSFTSLLHPCIRRVLFTRRPNQKTILSTYYNFKASKKNNSQLRRLTFNPMIDRRIWNFMNKQFGNASSLIQIKENINNLHKSITKKTSGSRT